MFRTVRAAAVALGAAAALLVPAVGQAQAAPVHLTHKAAVKHCAHHTTGTCKANSKHPKGATAKCKDGTYSYSAHFRGTCSHHKGVRYWYK
ncbi:DUF3761 domain-containing protein [Streptomyces sp. NPDC092296]|uniref:DUF3761 domain-containing protein n=1 Tax=Streptomyces sp. NPDC092296 TaxID=3366012 RepID=UPI003824FF9D